MCYDENHPTEYALKKKKKKKRHLLFFESERQRDRPFHSEKEF